MKKTKNHKEEKCKGGKISKNQLEKERDKLLERVIQN